MKNKLIVSSVIITQLVVITILGFHIYEKKTKVLGQMSIAPVPKENIVKTPSDTLTNFYELSADTVMKDDPKVPIASSYTINKDSLNERYNYATEKPDNTYRIITMGDSFTFGAYVPTKENWTEKLEDMLAAQCKSKKYEVINIGVGGYDIQYAAERYKVRGEKYNPDLVIWLLKDDDFDFPNELYLGKALEYETEMKKDPDYDKKYLQQGDYYPAWRKAAIELFDKYSRTELYAKSSSYLENFIKTYTDRKLLLVLLPKVRQETENAVNTMKSDMVSTYEIPTNIYENDKLYYPVDLHPTVQGHEVIAQEIHDYLLKNNVIPCN